MRLILVRHGEPNYQLDCLTETGKVQAQAAAKRLQEEKIDAFYSSTCGRAFETAQAAAALYGMEVHELPFMREISWWSGEERAFNGHPWKQTDELVREGYDLMSPDWKEHPYFKDSVVLQSYARVVDGLDPWLAELGYEREGSSYRCTKEQHGNIALFSHGGSSSVVLAHLLNLTFPYVCAMIRPNFTTITILHFRSAPGELVLPRIELLNDARHIRMTEPTYNN